MKSYKMMFTCLMMMGTLITISSYSWLSMWMGLEINLLSIIPLIQEKNNNLSTESSIKYFIIQVVASSFIMLAIIIESMKSNLMINIMMKSKTMIIMNSSILMKMGTAPFHFWLPEILEGMSWLNCLIMLTWQKIAPMVMLMYNLDFSLYMLMVIAISMIISGMMNMNQTSMRKIMAYSSINHMGWMIGSMMISKNIWLIYFVTYSLTTSIIVLIFNQMKIFYLNNLSQPMNNLLTKSAILVNFISIGGIPPFIGFMPKWLTIQSLIDKQLYLLSITMIIFTLMMTFIYLQISFNALIMSESNSKWTMNKKMKSFTMLTLNSLVIFSLIGSTLIFNLT